MGLIPWQLVSFMLPNTNVDKRLKRGKYELKKKNAASNLLTKQHAMQTPQSQEQISAEEPIHQMSYVNCSEL